MIMNRLISVAIISNKFCGKFKAIIYIVKNFFKIFLQNYVILVRIFIIIEKYVVKFNILILMIIVSKI